MSGSGADTEEARRELLAIATSIARDAAVVAARGWRSRPLVETKARSTDLVTEFDRETERVLRERLHAETAFAVIGEEQGADPRSSGERAVWFVDPIDGTTNFVHGHPFYCVSVGLVVDGEPALGVVVAPALATEWRGWVVADERGAHRGEAWRGDAICRVSSVPKLDEAMLATGFPYDRATSAENNFDAFVAFKKRAQAVRRCGSAALDLCLVADGTYDAYWERKLSVWDVAAGAAIVRAARGRVSTFGGGELALGSHGTRAPEILASNGLLHDAVIDGLAAL